MNTRSYLVATLTVLLFIFIPAAASAQAAYTATRSVRIQAGAGVMVLAPDYYDALNKGLTAYVDVDFNRWIGLEAEARLGGLIAPDSIGENSYLVGPRALYHHVRWTAYARLMAGRGTITNQFTGGASSFNLYAYGGGVEYRASHRINLRLADVEIQQWPSFFPQGLTPKAFTAGIAYVIR